MGVREFGLDEAKPEIRVPTATDDKYSRGVLGLATGSTMYPGAALLGVDGALATGVGMVRYSGPGTVQSAILERRPEVVFAPGRVSAWVVGSGMDPTDTEALTRVHTALADGVPTVVDAGALGSLPMSTVVVATPHAGELGALLGVDRAVVEANPAEHALLAASAWNATVVLKGSATHIANPRGDEFRVNLATPWLAVAGAGDVLAGIIGALMAGRASDIVNETNVLARIAATGVVLHSVAAVRASRGGPFLLERLVAEIPEVIREVIA